VYVSKCSSVTGDSFEKVGLDIPLRSIFKPSYSPHCININVGGKLSRTFEKMKIITSRQIGQLTQDKDFQDWWRGGEIEIPFFDGKKLPIVFMDFEPEADLKFIDEADNALFNFLRLDKQERLKLSNIVYQNYSDFLIDIGNDRNYKLAIQKNEDIWDFVHPCEIYVTRRRHRDKDRYVQIQCNCDWEEEHGLQLIFRQGRQITRVSDIDGHLTEADAYDKPDSEDELLSSFK
jgi:hypothetical protein